MIKAKKYLQRHWYNGLIILAFSLAFVVASIAPNNGLDYSIIEVDGGYGYKITKNEKLIIKQSFIPDTKGYRAFESEEDAKAVARMVINKLNKGESPSVNKSELLSLLN